MPPPFCRKCAAELLGPEIVAAARREAANAPPLKAEQRENLRALFASARAGRRSEPVAAKTCGH
jgi:hypothetical protein